MRTLLSPTPPARWTPRVAGVAFCCLWIQTANPAPGPPLLCGSGQAAFTPAEIAHLRGLIHAVTADATEEPWMLRCLAYQSGPHDGAPFRAEVYLTPRVFTPRLIRGRRLTCVPSLTPNTWNPASPVVGGWSNTDRQPCEYVMVSPPDRPFAAQGPFPEGFSVYPWMADAEVVAVVDAERAAAPEQQPTFLQPLDAEHARLTSEGTKGRKNLVIDFHKTGGVWTETKRSRWQD